VYDSGQCCTVWISFYLLTSFRFTIFHYINQFVCQTQDKTQKGDAKMKRGLFLTLLLLIAMLAGCTMPAPVTPAAGEGAVEQEVEETPEAAGEEEAEPSNLGTEENPLIMSFVPSGDTQEIITGGEEIEAMLEEMTGLAIESNVATSYAAVVEAMGAGNAHIGWLNTFSYLLAREVYNVEPILVTVRFGESFYTAQVVAGADTGIESLEDLAGAVMCWVDPLSTSGYIIPRVEIQAAGVNPDTDFAQTVEAGSHNNVIIAVYNGECDAGATFVDARTNVEDELTDVMDRVIVVDESAPIPNDNVSVIAELPEEIVTQIRDALVEIAQTPEGQEALQTVYSIESLEPTDDTFYDEFRAQLDAAGISVEDLAE
jgi:phosphonate transport system substrate-binding protein